MSKSGGLEKKLKVEPKVEPKQAEIGNASYEYDADRVPKGKNITEPTNQDNLIILWKYNEFYVCYFANPLELYNTDDKKYDDIIVKYSEYNKSITYTRLDDIGRDLKISTPIDFPTVKGNYAAELFNNEKEWIKTGERFIDAISYKLQGDLRKAINRRLTHAHAQVINGTGTNDPLPVDDRRNDIALVNPLIPVIRDLQAFVEYVADLNLDSAYNQLKIWEKRYKWNNLLSLEDSIINDEFYMLFADLVANEYRRNKYTIDQTVKQRDLMNREIKCALDIKLFYDKFHV